MITMADSPEFLRDKIKLSLDIMDIDDLKKLYHLISRIAAEKATKFANLDWTEKSLSREKINDEIKRYRQSKYK